MMRHRNYILAVVAASLLLFAQQYDNLAASNWDLGYGNGKLIQPPLFDLNIVNLEMGAGWPTFEFFGWRNFHATWPKVEPQQGRWNFSQLDTDIDLAEEKGVETLLVLAMTPTWASSRPNEKGCCEPTGSSAEPKSITLWENYVRTVAQRYKGRVKYYELWNEPNIRKHFSGSVDTLVELSAAAYKILKAVDPEIVVVCPSMAPGDDGVNYLNNYLQKGGRNYADVIGFHFYAGPKQPESILRQVMAVHEVMGKNGLGELELWNTEAGWPIRNQQPWSHGYGGNFVLDSSQAASYVARSYLLNWAAGISRFYWYAWGHSTMGLSDVDARTPKEAAYAYAIIRGWLLGASLESCNETVADLWECSLEWPAGDRAWVAWTTGEPKNYRILSGRKIKSVEKMLGEEECISLQEGVVIILTDMPVLMRSKSVRCNG